MAGNVNLLRQRIRAKQFRFWNVEQPVHETRAKRFAYKIFEANDSSKARGKLRGRISHLS